MGFAFYIKKNEPLWESDFFDSLELPIEGANEFEFHLRERNDENWPLLGKIMVSVTGFSSRGVLVAEEPEHYRIRVNTMASRADYLLTIELTRRAARIMNSTIFPEDAESPYSLERFDQDFDVEEWICGEWSTANSASHALSKVVTRIPGFNRDAYIGPFVIEKVKSDGFEGERLIEGLVEHLIKTQYLPEDVYVPRLRLDNFKNEKGFSEAILFNAAAKHLLPKVDIVYLKMYIAELGQEALMKVPFEIMKAYAMERWERLDDEQFIIPLLSESEYLQVYRDFEHGTDAWNALEEKSAVEDVKSSLQGSTTTKKPWWRFW